MTAAKAIAASIAGFLAPAGALIITQNGRMDSHDWLVAAATCVVAAAAVYAVPNRPA